MLTIRMYPRMIVKGDRAIKGECGSEAKRRIRHRAAGGCGWAVAMAVTVTAAQSPVCCVCGMERLWVYYCRVSSHTAQLTQ
jgi:hypothetical protein